MSSKAYLLYLSNKYSYEINTLKNIIEDTWLLHHTFIELCNSTILTTSTTYTHIQMFFELGINVNYVDYYGKHLTALYAAINSCNLNIITLLLNNKVDILQANPPARFNRTVQYKYLEYMFMHFKHNKISINIKLDMIKLLLNYSLKTTTIKLINTCYLYNTFILHHLITSKEDIQIIQLLLKYGVNIYITNQYNQNSIDLAALTYDTKLIQLLNKYDYIKNGALCIIKRFLKWSIYIPRYGLYYKLVLKNFNTYI